MIALMFDCCQSKGVINVESTVLVSARAFAKKNGIDPCMLNGLINQYKIKPDARYGKARLFRPERLQGIVDNLETVMKR